MRAPIFVRPLAADERARLRAGLRSKQAFTARRCQILLASADGARPASIARQLHCASATVRNAIHAFAREGLRSLTEKSHKPQAAEPALGPDRTDALKDLLHRSPRTLGKPTGLWTLDLLAEVCHARGWTPRRLTTEGIRLALKRLGIGWKRAKRWLTSPDPEYARKKDAATA